MQYCVKLSEPVQKMLRCPICKAKLELHDEYYQCQNSECNILFPIINDIPILIDDDSSIFSINDFINQHDTTFYLHQNKLEQVVARFVPKIDRNIKGRQNYNKLTKLLLSQSSAPKVLVIGGSILGTGIDVILKNSSIEFVESDVTFGPRTILMCDAHNIPFEDNSFDGVIVQAVPEHVVDPWRCVEEIHRILKEDGLVYAETPFMQQVHGGRFDFTRFTHLGHRRLFRKFDEICSGAVSGPASALALAYEYFLLSFVTSRGLRIFLRGFARMSAFWLKYVDRYLSHRPGTFDAATGYYFMGSKRARPIPDRELVGLYRGAMQ